MTCHAKLLASCAPAIAPGPKTASGWKDLEQCALEPAPAAAMQWLPPAMVHLDEAQKPAHFRVDDPRTGRPVLIAGLRKTRRFGLLGRLVTSRWSEFFFSGLPLLRAGDEARGLDGLLETVKKSGAAALELAAIPARGPFMTALEAHARENGLALIRLDAWERAALDATARPDDWWRNDIPKRRRKEYARLMRRLKEAGEVSFESLREGEDLAPWLDGFFSLEAEGWKGRAGTAIACDPAMRRFVISALRAHHAAGRLRFWRLRLDGEVIGTLFGYVIGGQLWLGKMAYAESLARFSPGVLLMIEATRAILADAAITRADSCADPNHPMIDHLWRGRLAMADVLIATPGTGRVRIRLLFALERGRRAARAAAKRLWHGLRRSLGRKRKRAA